MHETLAPSSFQGLCACLCTQKGVMRVRCYLIRLGTIACQKAALIIVVHCNYLAYSQAANDEAKKAELEALVKVGVSQ
jgi:hypothetical protein